MSERLLTLKEVCSRLSMSRSALWRLRMDIDYTGRKLGANFPPSVSLPGSGTIRWREAVLDRWVLEQAGNGGNQK